MISKSDEPATFSVLVVGCGLSGLASALALAQAGHHVTVFERSTKLQEIGAGIQLAPNATRLLDHWGVLEEVLKHADQLQVGNYRSYQGELVSNSPPVAHPDLVNDAPYIVIHRADLLRGLLSGTASRNIDIKLGCQVQDVDHDAPSVTLSTGEVFHGDLILGADGERSRCRAGLLGREDPPYDSGDVVYRISVPTKDMTPDHPAWELQNQSGVNFWMGPGGHVVLYHIQHDMLNMVLVYAEGKSAKVMYGPQPATLEEFRKIISGWDPVLHELTRVEGAVCTKWTLFQIHHPKQWSHDSGRFVLIGDAAHAILPCLAQGAAQAFEDAGVLGAIFRHPMNRGQLPDAVRVFEEVRKQRASDVQLYSSNQKALFSLPDGTQQQRRDIEFRNGADFDLFHWLWKYDANKSGTEAWEREAGVANGGERSVDLAKM